MGTTHISLLNRRQFIAKATVGSTLLLAAPVLGKTEHYLPTGAQVTVGQIMDLFISEVPGAPFEGTVDTLKSGNKNIEVTGIVTTMFATIDVIRKAISLNANFIIAHEPTFYNHRDETKWLEADDVYQYKANLLKQHNIAVWRNHDYIHSLKIDGVKKALSEQLGWQKFADPTRADIYNLGGPGLSLQALIAHAKTSLNIAGVRYIGNPDQICKKVLLFPGAAGGTRQITALVKTQPDVMMCGEISEWETAEYVRDAQAKGKPLCLIVLGHIASEEPGAQFMLGWLKAKYPAITASHVPSGNSLSFM